MSWIRIGCGSILLALAAAAAVAGSASRRVDFKRSVVNLESFSGSLQPVPPASVRRAPPTKVPTEPPALLFGEIFRQLANDPPTSREHNVPFAVLLEKGVVVRAWADANLNGNLLDDPAPSLSAYPGEPDSRSFLTTLRWTTRFEGRARAIERLVRVVIAAPDAEGVAPDYRIQDVYGMLGQVEVEGASRRALLFDGNQDGLFTRGRGDGMLFDLDDDRHFVVDPMAPDFGPFAIPFTVLGRSLAVDSVSWDGSRVTLSDRGAAPAPEAPARGRPAPDFSFVDLEGRLQRLSAHRGRPTVVYFWASWCASCRGQALELRDLLARPGGAKWDLLGICGDTDRAAALRFRAEYGATWPTSFSGGFTVEDPIARLYHEAVVGVFYVIGPDGVLVDKVLEVEHLRAALDKLSETAGEVSPGGR